METIKDLVDYFESEAIKKADGGFLSEKIRKFVREYYGREHKTPVSIYALYNAFKISNEIDIKDSYFRGVIEKAYSCFINDEGIQYVNLNQQKKLRLRKRKI